MAPLVVSTPPPTLTPIASIRPAVSASADWGTYVVRQGDSLYTIAQRHHTTVRALVSRNALPDGGRLIHPGQRLQVPGGSGPAATGAAVPAAASTATSTYTVRSGDTLIGIAQRHRTTARALAALNKISLTKHINPGQKLRVPESGATAAKAASSSKPAATPAPAPAAKPAATSTATSTYTVRSGDTLIGIAQRHRTTARALAALNKISLTKHIKPGQKLRVPESGATAAKAASSSKPAKPSGTSQPEMSTPFNSGGYSAKHFPSTTVSAAKKNHELLSTMPVPTREQTKAMIIATATRHGVDPALALAIGYQESGWNQRQVSVANAIGVMQVIPASGDWAGSMIGRELNLLDAQDNVTAGVVIIRALQRATSDEETAIASYYQGLTSVRTKGMYSDTRSYVRNIQALRAKFG
ncbi:MAG: LysM peptidoglycan-binding domain-containing protein [Intrasporangiaceae bacterium]|nr:LysM peptidoglycan-binding domain-containing protein [Intrasporangiaceae bacterium]